MIYNVVLDSGVQQSDPVIHIHMSILFQILFPHRLLQNTEQSSLCCIREILERGKILKMLRRKRRHWQRVSRGEARRSLQLALESR